MRFRPHHAWHGIRLTIAALLLAGALTACIGDDDESATPTPPSAPTLTGATGQVVTDGICNATIPIDWADSGTGRGTTANGASYSLFGGKAADDAAWDQAVQLALDRAGRIADAEVTQGDNFVRTTYPDDRGLDYRGRYDGVYCDFSVTVSTRPLTDAEKAGFEAAVASLGPAV
jgi:hypothetical protein